MKSTEQIRFLQDVYRERLALFLRHVEGAKQVGDYEANNTYQYIIGREEVQLQWIRDAILDLDGAVPTDAQPSAVPASGTGTAERVIYEDDARQMKAFVERWRPRLASLSNARHRKMLELTMGEVLEQTRLFEQESAGRDDVLGRRMPGASTGDGVLPVRWME